jgi:hypothetical protein
VIVASFAYDVHAQSNLVFQFWNRYPFLVYTSLPSNWTSAVQLTFIGDTVHCESIALASNAIVYVFSLITGVIVTGLDGIVNVVCCVLATPFGKPCHQLRS